MAARSQSRPSIAPRSGKLQVLDLEEPAGPLSRLACSLLIMTAIGMISYAARVWINPIRCWDFWHHITTGKWIFLHHRMPPGDLYSAASQGREWFVNSWLGDVLLWLPYQYTGSAGLLIFQFLISIAGFGIIAWMSNRITQRPTLSLLIAFLALMGSQYRYVARPELFTMLLMALMLAILYAYQLRLSERICWLIPIGIIWPNLHMGFTVAVPVLGAFLTANALFALCYSARKIPMPEEVIAGARLKRLAWASGAMLLGTLINPYGLKAWLFIRSLNGQFQYSQEWLPLLKQLDEIGPTSLACMMILTLMALTALALSRRPRDLVGLLLVAGFAGLSLKYSREAGHYCLVAPFVIAAAVEGLRFPQAIAPHAIKIRAAKRRNLGAGALLTIIILAFAALGTLGYPPEVARTRFGFGVDTLNFSPGSIRFLQRNNLVGAKVFNSLEAGNWLIWNLWPAQKVFIDGRMDMYGATAHGEYLEIARSAEIGDILTQMGVDYCYLRYPWGLEGVAERFPAVTLAHHRNWALVYYDDAALIFVRREPRYADLIARNEYRILHPLMMFELESLDLSRVRAQVLKEAQHSASECPQSANAHLTAGIALELLGRPREALERLARARELGTRWQEGPVRYLLEFQARAYTDLGQYPKAILSLEEAMRYLGSGERIAERESALRNNMGFVYLQAKQLDSAEREFHKALALSPDSAVAQINLGRLQMARHDYAGATKYLEKVLDGGQDYVDARILLAKCLAKIGRSEDALLQLEVATKLHRPSVMRSLRDPEFDSIRSNAGFQSLLHQ